MKRSTLEDAELDWVVNEYDIPSQFGVRLPDRDETVMKAAEGWNALFVDLFDKGGFRLPLHPFVEEFLNAYGIPPSGLGPNGWKILFGFMLACDELGQQCTLRRLSLFYDVKIMNGIFFLGAKPQRKLFKTSSSVHADRNMFFMCKPRSGWNIPTIWKKKTPAEFPNEGNEEENVFISLMESFASPKKGALIDVNKFCTKERLSEANISPHKGWWRGLSWRVG